MENILYIFHFVQNRPYSRYRHIFARIKVHGIKAMSRGYLVGQTSGRGGVCLFSQKETTILVVQNFAKFYSTIACYKDIYGSYCIKIRFYRL